MSYQILQTCRTASLTSRLALRPTVRLSQSRRTLWNSSKPETEGQQSTPEEPPAPEPTPTTPEKPTATDKSSNSEKPTQSAEELLTKLQQKEAEVVDITSRMRYLQADFLNLQRNAAREKEQQKDYAITRFAKDLLDTVDVLALALKSVPAHALTEAAAPTTPSSTPPETFTPSSSKSTSAHLKELHEGVDMTQRMLLQTLFKYHVKPFDPTGDAFDPNRHEALYQAVVPGKTGGTVIDCQKVGYLIRDRVLRAAQVGVAQDPPA